MGQVFCRWLREEKGVEPNDFDTYDHTYEDGRVVKARLYPLKYLSDFVGLFQEDWHKKRAEKYFKTRDAEVLEHLPRLLEGPASRSSTANS